MSEVDKVAEYDAKHGEYKPTTGKEVNTAASVLPHAPDPKPFKLHEGGEPTK